MRTTGTVTISLPPELAVEVDRLAHQEGRTRSELLREAFRQYAERRRRWDQLFAYAEARAAAGALHCGVDFAGVFGPQRRLDVGPAAGEVTQQPCGSEFVDAVDGDAGGEAVIECSSARRKQASHARQPGPSRGGLWP